MAISEKTLLAIAVPPVRKGDWEGREGKGYGREEGRKRLRDRGMKGARRGDKMRGERGGSEREGYGRGIKGKGESKIEEERRGEERKEDKMRGEERKRIIKGG